MNYPSTNHWTSIWSAINILFNILILYYLVSNIRPVINIILFSVIILSTVIHFITFLFHLIGNVNNLHVHKRYLLNIVIDVSILYVLIFIVSRKDISNTIDISLYVAKLTWVSIYLVPIINATKQNTHDNLAEVFLDPQNSINYVPLNNDINNENHK